MSVIARRAYAWIVVSILLAFPLTIKADAKEGEKAFKMHCTICHGPDGSGNTSIGKTMQAADLRSAAVQKKPDAELIEVIEYGKGSGMPPFITKLTADQIKDVVLHLRTLAKKSKTGAS